MQVISNVAAKVAGTGAATSVGSAAFAKVQTIWGYSVDEWTVIFGVGGLLVALLGLVVSSVLKVLDYFDKKRHRRLLEMNQKTFIHRHILSSHRDRGVDQ